MANHDDAGQQETQDSSTEWTPSGEPPAEQEEGRHIGQGVSEQGHQGLVPPQEAAYEHSSLQEHGVPPQGEMDTPPQRALEPVDPMMDQPDDETLSRAPEEPSERETVPVPATLLEAEGEQPPNE